MPKLEYVLTTEFVHNVINARIFTAHVTALAIELAREANEPVTRPLTQAQIERAILTNGIENRLVMDALVARLETLYHEGQLPGDASVPRW